MARSSLRRGRKMPGVSTSRICAAPRIRMPSTRNRVVCAFGLTIDSLAPVSRFSSVDLPAFGRADDGDEAAARMRRSSPAAAPAGRPPRPARRAACCRPCRCPPGRRRVTVMTNSGACGGPGARGHLVDRQRQAARHQPFLQRGLRVLRRLGHARPSPAAQARAHEAPRRRRGRRRDRARRSAPPSRPPARWRSWPHAGPRLARRRSPAPPTARPRSAISASTWRDTRWACRGPSSPSCSSGKRSISHSAISRPEHPVADELQPLVGAGAAPLGRCGRGAPCAAERWVSASRSRLAGAKRWPRIASARALAAASAAPPLN